MKLPDALVAMRLDGAMLWARRLKIVPKPRNPATTENWSVDFDRAKTLPMRGQAAGILTAGKV